MVGPKERHRSFNGTGSLGAKRPHEPPPSPDAIRVARGLSARSLLRAGARRLLSSLATTVEHVHGGQEEPGVEVLRPAQCRSLRQKPLACPA